MQRLYLLAALSGILMLSCSLQPNGDPLQKTLSIENAKRDFEIFRKITEFAHPSPFLYIQKRELSFQFDSVYQSIYNGIPLRDFHYKLRYLVNRIGCSNTLVHLPAQVYDTLLNRPYFFPLPLIYVNNKLLVNSSHDLAPGTEILSVEGRPVSRIIDSLQMYNSVDGLPRETQKYYAARNFGLEYFLRRGPVKNFRTLILDTSGTKKNLQLQAITLNELNTRESELYYWDATDVPYLLYFSDKEDYAVLRFRTFDFYSENQKTSFEIFIENSFELIRKKPSVKHLVIDIRENGGGSFYNCFLLYSYIATQPFREYKSITTRITSIPHKGYLVDEYELGQIQEMNNTLAKFTRAGSKNYIYPDTAVSDWEPAEHRFKGNVFVITNPVVASSASYFATMVKNSGRGKIIGVETDGGEYSYNGMFILKYKLPHSGLEFSFPFARYQYSYAGNKTGRGVVPDFIVPDDDLSFKNNTDKQLLFVIDSLIK